MKISNENKPVISIICAMDENKGIGYKNKIPWHIKEDLIRFKKLTEGKTIIIGRITFESLLYYYKKSKRPFPRRNTIVITSQKNYQKKFENENFINFFFVHSFDQALKLGKKIEKKEIFIAGGEKIFRKGINFSQKIYLTVIKGKYQTDSFFPDYDNFEVVSEEKKNDGKYEYKFLILRAKKNFY